MKRRFLFFILGIVAVSSIGESAAFSPSNLKFTADVTLASKYMLDGFKVGGDHPVWQFAAKTDLYSSGFSLMYWAAMQANRENSQYDEQDFFVLYSHDFFKDEKYKLNFHGFYDYWLFPNTEPARDDYGAVISTKDKHGNKFQVGISMPQLIPLAGSFLVPSYNIYQWLYWEQDRKDMNRSGAHHELLLEYYRAIRIFIPGATYQYSGASASLNYNDGAFEVKPGISHATASLITGVYALKSIFTLSINHQWTYEKTLNATNELWSTFSYIKKF